MALLCEEISLCSGEMLQHNSSLGEAYLGRFKTLRFSGLFVKMLSGSAQEVKQSRTSSDQVKKVMEVI